MILFLPYKQFFCKPTTYQVYQWDRRTLQRFWIFSYLQTMYGHWKSMFLQRRNIMTIFVCFEQLQAPSRENSRPRKQKRCSCSTYRCKECAKFLQILPELLTDLPNVEKFCCCEIRVFSAVGRRKQSISKQFTIPEKVEAIRHANNFIKQLLLQIDSCVIRDLGRPFKRFKCMKCDQSQE